MSHTLVSLFVDFYLPSHTVSSLHTHRFNSAHSFGVDMVLMEAGVGGWGGGAAAVGVLVCLWVKISSALCGNNRWAGSAASEKGADTARGKCFCDCKAGDKGGLL